MKDAEKGSARRGAGPIAGRPALSTRCHEALDFIRGREKFDFESLRRIRQFGAVPFIE
jgi:hypothetical protein